MSKSQKIIICLIIAFFCFLPSGSVVNNDINLSAEETEAYAFAGLFAYMDPQVEQPKVPDVVSKDCKCKNGKVSYDGGGSLTDCPCKDGTCDCGCKSSKSKASGASEEVQIKEKKVRMILVTDPPNCGPCRDVDRTLLATLRNEQHKKAGWTIGNSETDTIQVLSLSNPEEAKIIEELELSYFAIPAFVRYGSDDENLVGNVSYETFLRYFHGGNKIPSYKGKTKTRWNINGDFSPSKETLIKHIRTDKDHVAVASWPLELLSREDLTALHSDLHNKDYGQIEWRDK
jgi:hypothetical protein